MKHLIKIIYAMITFKNQYYLKPTYSGWERGDYKRSLFFWGKELIEYNCPNYSFFIIHTDKYEKIRRTEKKMNRLQIIKSWIKTYAGEL